MLADFTTARSSGVPVLAVCVIAVAAVMHVVLHRTVYGRSVTAIGQNPRAARPGRRRGGAGALRGLRAQRGLRRPGGFLLAGFSGGAALNMGEEYLLTSIAVVVIGGTSVAGGYGNVPGLWGAALFLFLLVTMLNTFGFGAGIR